MFKISIFVSLLAIAFTTASTVKPQSINYQSVSQYYSVSPRELISLARQGQFKAQDIPSHNNFRHRVRTGKITAKELVASVIANNCLSQKVASDRNYLNAVADHLKSGGCGT